MESNNHVTLKWKAVEWLYTNAKCKYIATEVKIGRYIFDVAGSDGSRVWIIEAKQSKTDFTRDCHSVVEIKENIKKYKKLLKETNDEMYIKKIKDERGKSIKFYDPALYRLSSHRYIIAPLGLIGDDLVPSRWGLLDEEPKVINKAPGNHCDKRFVDKVIREICRKNTKKLLECNGVIFGKQIEFPFMELN